MDAPADNSDPSGNLHDAAIAAHIETERAERSRWNGTLLMYSPLLPLMVMICGMVEAFVAGWSPGPHSTQPPWYMMLPFMVGGIGLLPAIPVAIVGAGKRMLGAVRLSRLSQSHRVESLGPWPAVAPGERIGPLLVEEVAQGRLSLVYMPTPRLIWRVLGFCAGGIFTGVLILVAVLFVQLRLPGRDLANLILPAVMLVAILGYFGTRRLSFETSANGPIYVTRYRFPGIPFWFRRQRPLTWKHGADFDPSERLRHAAVFIAQSGIRWGLDGGAFGAWKMRRLEQTIAQCLQPATPD